MSRSACWRWCSSGGLAGDQVGWSVVRATKASSRSAPVTSRSRNGDVRACTSARTVASASVVRSVTSAPRISTAVTPGSAAEAAASGSGSGRTGRSDRSTPALDRAAGAVGHDPAVVEDHDPVGDLVRLLEVVRREQDRPALVRRSGACRAQKARRVSTSMATVGSSRKTRSGSPAMAMREAQALGLAARQAPRPDRPVERGQAGPLEDGGARQRVRVEPPCELDELADAGVGRQPAVLEHRPDPAARHGRRGRQAERSDDPRGRLEEAEQQADGGRLAGAVGPQQSDRLTGRDRQVDAVESGHRAETPRDGLESDGDRGWRRVRPPVVASRRGDRLERVSGGSSRNLGMRCGHAVSLGARGLRLQSRPS